MVISLAKRSASRTISSKALRKISARSRGLRPAQPSNASCAASIAALASSTLALATEAILFSVAGSITSKRAPSDDLRHLPPIHRSVGTLASRLSYLALNPDAQRPIPAACYWGSSLDLDEHVSVDGVAEGFQVVNLA